MTMTEEESSKPTESSLSEIALSENADAAADEVKEMDPENKDTVTITNETPSPRNWPKTILTHVFAPVLIIYGVVAMGRDVAGAVRSSQKQGTITDSGTTASSNEFDGHINLRNVHTGPSYRMKSYFNPEAKLQNKMDGALANIADVNSPIDSENELPFLWLVENGANRIPSMFEKCVPLTMAVPYGIRGGVPSFDVIDPPLEEYYGKHLDLNMAQLDSVDYAYANGMVKNTDVNFIASPHLYETASLFSSSKKGRIFGLFPNVGSIVHGGYGYLHSAGLYDGTLLEFVQSNHVLSNNYITRMLSGKWEDDSEVTEDDYQAAAHLMKKKFVLVPNSDQHLLVEKLVDIFDWNKLSLACIYPPPKSIREKVKQEEEKHHHHKSRPPKTDEDHEIDRIITERNSYDIRLFGIAKETTQWLVSETKKVSQGREKESGGILQGLGKIARSGIFSN